MSKQLFFFIYFMPKMDKLNKNLFHISSHLIAITALVVACFAITNYITYDKEVTFNKGLKTGGDIVPTKDKTYHLGSSTWDKDPQAANAKRFDEVHAMSVAASTVAASTVAASTVFAKTVDAESNTMRLKTTAGLDLVTSANARTINVGTGNAVQKVNIGSHATPANVITIGGLASTTTIGGSSTLTGATALGSTLGITGISTLTGGLVLGTETIASGPLTPAIPVSFITVSGTKAYNLEDGATAGTIKHISVKTVASTPVGVFDTSQYLGRLGNSSF